MDIRESADQLGIEESEYLELLALFLETSETDLRVLQDALYSGDTGSAMEAAHSIKGASANLGFMEISQLARDVEQDAQEASIEGSAEAVVKIYEKLASLKNVIESR